MRQCAQAADRDEDLIEVVVWHPWPDIDEIAFVRLRYLPQDIPARADRIEDVTRFLDRQLREVLMGDPDPESTWWTVNVLRGAFLG